MRCIFFPIIIVTVVVLRGVSSAQTIPKDSLNSMLEQAKAYYNNAEYENAIVQLEKALQFLRLLKGSDQVEAYKYLAFSYVAFGDKEKAKEQFRKVLALNPELDLDPATVSPKIIKVFEETKSEMPVSPPPSPVSEPASSPPAVSPIVQATPSPPGAPLSLPPSSKSRIGAVLRSCLMPGWGQRYHGEMSKGTKITIAAGVSFGAALLSGIITSSRHLTYKNAPPEKSAEINNTYRSYKIWYNISSLCILSFSGIYIYNVGDAIFSSGKGTMSMTEPLNNDVHLCFTIEF
jgi:tetratricopeptide (TPR) repeat protein